MRGRRMAAGIAAAAVLGLAAGGIAAAADGGSSSSGGTRLDDGKDLLGQAKITEAEAISAARSAASGELDEVDLEHVDGKLVFNVDVGSKDVKVDAASGQVVSADSDN
jgi:uncharacterized membrane protein YkoI